MYIYSLLIKNNKTTSQKYSFILLVSKVSSHYHLSINHLLRVKHDLLD